VNLSSAIECFASQSWWPHSTTQRRQRRRPLLPDAAALFAARTRACIHARRSAELARPLRKRGHQDATAATRATGGCLAGAVGVHPCARDAPSNLSGRAAPLPEHAGEVTRKRRRKPRRDNVNRCSPAPKIPPTCARSTCPWRPSRTSSSQPIGTN
jgi:hypothetical protein